MNLQFRGAGLKTYKTFKKQKQQQFQIKHFMLTQILKLIDLEIFGNVGFPYLSGITLIFRKLRKSTCLKFKLNIWIK